MFNTQQEIYSALVNGDAIINNNTQIVYQFRNGVLMRREDRSWKPTTCVFDIPLQYDRFDIEDWENNIGSGVLCWVKNKEYDGYGYDIALITKIVKTNGKSVYYSFSNDWTYAEPLSIDEIKEYLIGVELC